MPFQIVEPREFSIGDQVRIKLHDKVLTVTARPSPGKYHLFGGAGKSLCNVPEELIEPAPQEPATVAAARTLR
jgi:hypothetical protein